MPRMPRRLSRAGLLATPLALLTLFGSLTTTPSLAAEEPAPRAAVRTARALAADGGVTLDRSARGAAVVRALGSDLAAAAALNDMTPAGLRAELRTDPTLWLDTRGKAYYREQAADPAVRAATPAASVAAYPLEETFALHSRAGAARTIFLDLDGARVQRTRWNVDPDGTGPRPALPAGTHPGWDPAGDGPAFSDAERAMVQQIWAEVAEDYAPFDVDVTTEDPGDAALTRTDAADQTYGAHVLITGSTTAPAVLCDSACGGLAYLDVFDHHPGADPTPHAAYRPAWVFTALLHDDPQAIAEAASHEVGHTLGLEHDGLVEDPKDPAHVEYYAGHGAWAPIMGGGSERPVTQWSAGDYADASNPGQDDVAEVAALLGLRGDEAGSTIETAGASLPPSGVITTRQDVDVYALGACGPDVTVTAAPAAVAPNLDVRLSLLDAKGTEVGVADPLSSFVSRSAAAGLDATLATPVEPGAYFVAVEGTGAGDPLTSYDDYGSLGAYDIAATGCDQPVAEGAPGVPQALVATPHAIQPSVALTWSAPADPGSSPVTGYQLTRSGSAETLMLPPDATSRTVTGLQPGETPTFTLRALNDAGPGVGVSATATVADVRTPGAPEALAAIWSAAARRIEVTWTAPASDGGAPVVAYDVLLDGTRLGTFDADTSTVWITGATPGATYRVAVTTCTSASEQVGCSGAAQTTVSVPLVVRVPGAPRIGAALGGARGKPVTARVRWAPPTSTGGAVVTGYQVVATRLNLKGRATGTFRSPVLGPTARSAELRLPAGRYRFAVRARNSAGFGPLSAASTVVRAR